MAGRSHFEITDLSAVRDRSGVTEIGLSLLSISQQCVGICVGPWSAGHARSVSRHCQACHCRQRQVFLPAAPSPTLTR